MNLTRNLFDFERETTPGEVLFFKIFEGFILFATIEMAWTWGLYARRISEGRLPARHGYLHRHVGFLWQRSPAGERRAYHRTGCRRLLSVLAMGIPARLGADALPVRHALHAWCQPARLEPGRDDAARAGPGNARVQGRPLAAPVRARDDVLLRRARLHLSGGCASLSARVSLG